MSTYGRNFETSLRWSSLSGHGIEAGQAEHAVDRPTSLYTVAGEKWGALPYYFFTDDILAPQIDSDDATFLKVCDHLENFNTIEGTNAFDRDALINTFQNVSTSLKDVTSSGAAGKNEMLTHIPISAVVVGPFPPGPLPDDTVTPAWGDTPDGPIRVTEPQFVLTEQGSDSETSLDNNSFEGGSDGETVFGNDGNDTIFGGGGQDAISGGVGEDWIDAGIGHDMVLGDAGFDTISGGAGNDTVLGGNGADSLYGGDGDDALLGGAGFDQLYGEDGDDVMWSGDTADRLYGGAGNDWMSAGTNVGATVDGLWGGTGNDTMFGDAGFDLLDGGAGDDVMDGGDQADNLYGREGNDTVFGGQGLDRLFGGAGDDQLVGGSGNDGHFGDQGNDTAWGGSGDDRFFGGTGDDVLLGEAGQDSLYGGAGFDTLVGGAGDDVMTGDFNADRFIFETEHGNDVITDFDARNDFEVLDFSSLAGFDTIEDVWGASEQSDTDVLISTGANSSILLRDVSLADLGVGDFLF